MNNKYFIILYITLSTIQNINSMQEMAIMMGAQQGAMIATQAINKEYQEMFTSIQSNQQTLTNAITSFMHDMQAAKKKEMNNLINIFSEAENHINNTQSQQIQFSTEMQTYIFQAIDIQKPQHYYLLSESINLDELFTHGTMYTPQTISWKNPFGIGNWEYDHTTDSFWQQHNNASAKDLIGSSHKGMQNSIFTEYFIRKNSYAIQCEITLHQVHYPFFVGILFNKTRWISGNSDSITKCRMLGIHGSSKDNVMSCFAEQYIQKSKNSNSTTIYPLQQIIQGKSPSKNTIDTALTTNFQTNPTTFVLKVITSPMSIQYKIWPKQHKEPNEYITVKSKNPDLYLYHNIGFISPGAIAQFKLIKPEDLLFTQDAIQNYSKNIEMLLSS